MEFKPLPRTYGRGRKRGSRPPLRPVAARNALAPGAAPLRLRPTPAPAPAPAKPVKMTQLFLDLGQRDFGSKMCAKCGLLFAPGKAADEAAHRRHCGAKRRERDAVTLSAEAIAALAALAATVVREGSVDDLVVRASAVRGGAARARIARVVEAMADALAWDDDRGSARGGVYVYVDAATRAVAGCVAVERVAPNAFISRHAAASVVSPGGSPVGAAAAARSAHDDAPTPLATTATTPLVAQHEPTCMLRYCGTEASAAACGCARRRAATRDAARPRGGDAAAASLLAATPPPTLGVQRIWVHPHHRRRGVASRLLSAVARDFVLGHRVARSEIAFTEPTAEGRAFGRAFCGGAVRIYRSAGS